MSIKHPKTRIKHRVESARKTENRVLSSMDEDAQEIARLKLSSKTENLPLYARLRKEATFNEYGEPVKVTQHTEVIVDDDGVPHKIVWDTYATEESNERRQRRVRQDIVLPHEAPKNIFNTNPFVKDDSKIDLRSSQLKVRPEVLPDLSQYTWANGKDYRIFKGKDEDADTFGEVGLDDISLAGTLHKVVVAAGSRNLEGKRGKRDTKAFVMINVPEKQMLQKAYMRQVRKRNRKKQQELKDKLSQVVIPPHIASRGDEVVNNAYRDYILRLRGVK